MPIWRRSRESISLTIGWNPAWFPLGYCLSAPRELFCQLCQIIIKTTPSSFCLQLSSGDRLQESDTNDSGSLRSDPDAVSNKPGTKQHAAKQCMVYCAKPWPAGWARKLHSTRKFRTLEWVEDERKSWNCLEESIKG